ncbi:MAG: tRNA1(Val) (adenine(37)-N6)-methyltransferase [Oscillospiraceae bacterium]
MDIIYNDFYGIEMATTKEYGFGGDALLLAEFAKPKYSDKVLDLCTGCGVVPIMMMANGFKGRVTAVDIQPGAVELCRLTAAKNSLEDRLIPVCADLNKLDFPAESFSLITVNPPYFVSGAGKENGTEARDLARRESGCTLAQVAAVSARLLKYGGRLCMCHRPERLSDVIFEMRRNKIEPKRLTFVNNATESREPWLILVEGKKGGHAGIKINYIQNGR